MKKKKWIIKILKLELNAGITCGTGINVNARMEKSIPGIYDIGDFALFNNVNQGLWAPSSEMGKVVSAKAAGSNKSFALAPEHVSLIVMDSELIIVGTPPQSKGGYNIITKKTSRIIIFWPCTY